MKLSERAAGVNLSVDLNGANILLTRPSVLPRVDIILRDGTVLVGTPTAGATLDNLKGAAARWADNVEGYVLVPAFATHVTNEHIAPDLHSRAINDGIARLAAEIAEGRA